MNAPFNDPKMAKLWNSYFAEFDRLSSSLGDEGRELRGDLERHVLESMETASTDPDPTRQLEKTLRQLGHPNDYLHSFLGDRHITRATHTFNPAAVGKRLFHNILGGGGRMLAASLFALGYLFVAVFVVMAVLKPFWPNNIGIFRAPDGAISAGIIKHIAEKQELLGWSIIPVALILAAMIYLLLTWGLGRLIPKR